MSILKLLITPILSLSFFVALFVDNVEPSSSKTIKIDIDSVEVLHCSKCMIEKAMGKQSELLTLAIDNTSMYKTERPKLQYKKQVSKSVHHKFTFKNFALSSVAMKK